MEAFKINNVLMCGAWRTKKNGDILVKRHGPVNNMPCDANSLRPGLYGILSVISYANHVIQKHGDGVNRVPPIIVYTDSETSILNSRKTFFPTTKNVLDDNVDIKTQLAATLKQTAPQIVLRHVRAHQNQSIPWEKMNIQTRLNVTMDDYVNQYFQTTKKTLPHKRETRFLPAQKINITLHNDTPTSNILERLRNFRTGHIAEKDIKRKLRIKDKLMCKINWEAIKLTYKNYSKTMKIKVTKAVYEQWHTMKVAKRCGLSLNDRCPCCMESTEN